MALMLLIGTTNGLWEIGALPTRRWRWQQQQPRRVLANKTIAALTQFPDGTVLAATADGKLWQRAPGQRWRGHIIGTSSTTHKQEHVLTTALAAGGDGRLWRGTMPVSLWHTSLASDTHTALSWQQCTMLAAQAEAKQWWGPCDPATPLVTAIAPDPRDAQAVTIAIAVGGVYHTADGGQTWQAQHRGIAPLVRQGTPGHDAHRHVLGLTRHPSFPELLYATSASAIYRADTTSTPWRWEDITPPHATALLELPGLVTPIPHERDAALAVLPLMADETRCTLWQTHDGGITWQECAGAPVLSTPIMTSASPEATTITVAISHIAPEYVAIVTPGGDVYLTDGTNDETQWRHMATDLGNVTCVCWAER